jgi:hypothetical protein
MKQVLTKHAKKRMRQRGFSGYTMAMIVNYGHYEPAPGDALKVSFRNKDHQELVSRLKKDLQILDNAKGGTLILSADGQILTSYKNK